MNLQVAKLREEIGQRTRRGAFFAALADDPAAFLHTATASLAEVRYAEKRTVTQIRELATLSGRIPPHRHRVPGRGLASSEEGNT
jgi:hypothetical protein